MEILSIIPARGGSKGIRRKNLVIINDRPLVAWSIMAAKEARGISRIIVSTEDEEIAEVSKKFGAEVPFLRSSEYAEDKVHAIHAVLHTLSELKKLENYVPDIVVMLLPTSPLRTARDIDDAVAIQKKDMKASVISVCAQDKYLTQLRMISDDVLKPVVSAANYNTQRQDAEILYAANGSIFISPNLSLLKNESFHQLRTRSYIMPAERSIDIDTEFDLRLVRLLMST